MFPRCLRKTLLGCKAGKRLTYSLKRSTEISKGEKDSQIIGFSQKYTEKGRGNFALGNGKNH